MNTRNKIVSLIRNEVLESEDGGLLNAPLVGFAAADDPLFARLKEIVGPEHVHPTDILPEAKTVVAFFIPFAKKVVLSNRKSSAVAAEWARAYLEANNLIADTSHVKLFLFSFFLNVNFSLFIKDFIVIFHPVYIQ